MKIKTIKKYEDNSRIVNVNFVTSVIENSQVSIGMKYFVIECFNKGNMSYNVGTALDEEGLVNKLNNFCLYTMEEYKFKRLVDDIVKETPKFCYVYDNIWKYVLEYKYHFQDTVEAVEKAIEKDINTYHNRKLYDLLSDEEKAHFENDHPQKEDKEEWDDKMYLTSDYNELNDLLWKWFDTLTKGKYELVDDVLYNKAKKAEEKLSVLKYKELGEDDLDEVRKFVLTQLNDDSKGWYHNTGDMDVTCKDGRKLRISEVDTLELAISLGKDVITKNPNPKGVGDMIICGTDVNLIGDYICRIGFDVYNLFKDATFVSGIEYETIDRAYRKAVKMIDYNENRFYEFNTPYGRFGYNVYDVREGLFKCAGSTLYVTKINEKSIQFITSDHFEFKDTLNEDNIEKRKLETEWKNGECRESFTFFKTITPKNRTRFSPERLMDDTRKNIKNYYEDAVKRFGEPIVEQKTSEQELVAAASEAL